MMEPEPHAKRPRPPSYSPPRRARVLAQHVYAGSEHSGGHPEAGSQPDGQESILWDHSAPGAERESGAAFLTGANLVEIGGAYESSAAGWLGPDVCGDVDRWGRAGDDDGILAWVQVVPHSVMGTQIQFAGGVEHQEAPPPIYGYVIVDPAGLEHLLAAARASHHVDLILSMYCTPL